MKSKILLILVALLLAGPALSAQDLLVRNNGEEMEVKVLEVSRDYVKYRKLSNLNGPVFTVSVADIFMIKYEDGTKTVFGADVYGADAGNQSGTINQENAQPVKLEKVLRPTRMQIGVMVRPAGVSLFSIGSNYVDGVYYESSDGVRYHASFGATFDYWLSDEIQKKWYLEGRLMYSLMGGKTESETYNLDYITLDAGLGVRGRMFWTFYIGVGILANAKYTNVELPSGTKIKMYENCNPVIFRLGTDFGACIGKYIDLGVFYEVSPSNLVKPETFNGYGDTFNWCVGLTFCYRFDIVRKNNTIQQL